jgi:UPF0716 protein FxsA
MRPVLLVLFLVLPVLEVLVLVQVGQAIGGWWLALILAAQAVLGGGIVKHEGRRAWRRLNEALAQGRSPERGSADAALILAGGVLLALPGLLTDVPALLLLLPFTRPLVRGMLLSWAERRVERLQAQGFPASPGFPPGPFPGPFGRHAEHPQRPRGERGGPGVIRGEVLKEEPGAANDAGYGNETGDGGRDRRPLEP